MSGNSSQILRLRIVKVDYYMNESPVQGLDQLYSDFRGEETSIVPVIRIFGVTDSGIKGCLHVHGFFPYLFVPLEAQDSSEKQSYIRRLAQELDNNIASNRRGRFDGVHNIECVKRIPFYGYHASPRQFLKIQFYNPNHLKKASELIQKGSIVGQEMLVHEGHIPYILKFFIDFNLFGMNFINVKDPTIRDGFENDELKITDKVMSNLKKMTVCTIEADCKTENILNVYEISKGIASNPGLRLIWDEERQRRKDLGISAEICPPLSQERTNSYVSENEREFITRLKESVRANNRVPYEENFMSQTQSSNSRSTSFVHDSANNFQQLPTTSDMNDNLDNDSDEEKDDFLAKEMSQSFRDIFTEPNPLSTVNMPNFDQQVGSVNLDNHPVHDSLNSHNFYQQNQMNAPSTSRKVQQNLSQNQVFSTEPTPPHTSNNFYQSQAHFSFKQLPLETNCQAQFNSFNNDSPPFHQSDHHPTMSHDQIHTNVFPAENMQCAIPSPFFGPEHNQVDAGQTQFSAVLSVPNDPVPPTSSHDKFLQYSHQESVGVSSSHTNSHHTSELVNNDFITSVNQNVALVSAPNHASFTSNRQCNCAIEDYCDICCDFEEEQSEGEKLSDWSMIPQLDGSFDEILKKKAKKDSKLRFTPLPVRITRLRRAPNTGPLDDMPSSSSAHNQERDKKNAFSLLDRMVKDLTSCQPKKPSISPNKEASQTEQPSEKRVFKCIKGDNVLVPASIDESVFTQIGREYVQVSEPSNFSPVEVSQVLHKKFPKPSEELSAKLKGKARTQYLLSLCRPLEVHLDFYEDLEAFEKDTKIPQDKSDHLKIQAETSTLSNSLKNQPELFLDSKLVSGSMANAVKTSLIERKSFSNDKDEKNLMSWESTSSHSSQDKISSSSSDEPEKILTQPCQESKFIECCSQRPNSQRSTDFIDTIAEEENPIGKQNGMKNSADELIYSQNLTDSMDSHGPQSEALSIQESSSYPSNPTPTCLSQSFSPSSLDNMQSTPQISKKRSAPQDNFNPSILEPIPEDVSTKSGDEAIQNFAKGSLLNLHHDRTFKRQSYDSLIEGLTRSETFNFAIGSLDSGPKVNETSSKGYSQHEYQFLTCMCLEVHASTDKNKNPDPAMNSMRAVFYGIMNDVPPSHSIKQSTMGIIVIDTDSEELAGCNDSILLPLQRKLLARSGFHKNSLEVTYATDEIDLLSKFVSIVKKHDPDILVGYEIELSSWAYLLQRAEALNVKIGPAISRVVDEKYAKCTSEYDLEFRTGIQISGRIVLNLWRIIRKELKLNMYSYENVHFHVLHQRIPGYSYQNLSDWFDSPTNIDRWRVLEHYLVRLDGVLRMIDKLEIISQTSELARLFGIQFYEVFSRGSQFRVESMMFRTAKPLNYVMPSHSALQRARMRIFDCLPLVMEPESNFYTDPIVVLDFQSLYPSVMIAYNYCYSTCLGRVENIEKDEKFEFGCSSHYLPTHILKQHLDEIHVSPCGVAFLKSHVRRGVIPQTLEEILTTRIMVKNSIKLNNKRSTPSKSLHRLLNARQLGLKLISNVTYGYTSASFSGRMPCIEIGDSIVSKGREILERAINMINNHPSWGGKVVYGDTDSLFVLFPGISKNEAFVRGQEMVLAVTDDNPYPVKLKFEKVYQPCVLQTKKRYVGFMWETPDQKEPILEAKGNEAIRRDTCPAACKILEKSLKILFTTQDVDGAVKPYVQRQFTKILKGRIGCLQDFIFAREYRGMEHYTPNACVPSLKIAKKLRETNPRAEPLHKERVPYVIVYGTPEQPLIQLVKQPLELVQNPYLRLNATYYIERIIIPTLNRIFSLLGYDAMKWYSELPRMNTYQRSLYLNVKESSSRPRTLPQYFTLGQCPVCGQKASNDEICPSCITQPIHAAVNLKEEIRSIEKRFHAIVSICKSCTGSHDIDPNCVSVECPQLFRYSQSRLDIHNINYFNKLLERLKVFTFQSSSVTPNCF